MKAWNVAEMDVDAHHPRVLVSESEGRVIAMQLPAGEKLAEHQVHERAWLYVVSGQVEIDDSDGETLGGGVGLLAEFNPNERREVRAIVTSRILLILSPWPGDGHPSAR